MSKKLRHQFACSSMMLPEHRGSLNRRRKEMERREQHRRPLLDEQEQELFQQTLQRSLQESAPLTLTVLNENSGCRRLTGVVVKLEPWSGCLRLRTAAAAETVLIDEVVAVEPAIQEPSPLELAQETDGHGVAVDDAFAGFNRSNNG